MRHLLRPYWLLMAGLSFCSGCANTPLSEATSLKPEQAKPAQSEAAAATPEMRLSDHQQWINRLIVTPAHEGVTPVAGTTGTPAVIPIPVPQAYAAGGKSFHLKVDRQAYLAWLTIGGAGGQLQEEHGPWTLDNSDVKHILSSLQNPPAGVTVQSAPTGDAVTR